MTKCCDVTIADLRWQIQIQNKEPTGATDPMGGVIVDWVTVATPWAKMKPMTGTEQYRADKLNAVGITQVIIRYRSGLNEAMKVVYKGEDYQIRSIIDMEEKRQWLELMIEKGVSQ